MTEETKAMNALLENIMLQADDQYKQLIRETFKNAIEGYAADLLENEEAKQPQDELEALQSMTIEALAGLGLIAAQRIDWEEVGNPQNIETGILN